MSLDALRESLPAYAKDLSLNLSSLASETLLTDQQKWGTFLASAYAVGMPAVVKAIEASAKEAGLSEEAMTAAKAAAAIMGMNNVYYRALHLISNPEYRTLPAKLRMNIMANPGVDEVAFELRCTAVSAVNGSVRPSRLISRVQGAAFNQWYNTRTGRNQSTGPERRTMSGLDRASTTASTSRRFVLRCAAQGEGALYLENVELIAVYTGET